MRKKSEDDILYDYQRLKNEMIHDKVDEIFRKHPGNYISAMEEIGFKYNDDDDRDEIEEKNAQPENQNQRDLVDYFEGHLELSESILTAFLKEKDAEEPNLALIRKYFKQANQYVCPVCLATSPLPQLSSLKISRLAHANRWPCVMPSHL